MFSGAHILLYSRNPEADRAFFRDVLKFRHVDAGEGWLIFALPPAEAGIHPLEDQGSHGETSGGHLTTAELYLMCSDLQGMIEGLKKQGVRCSEVETAGWGMKTTIVLPSGSEIGLYQPRHRTVV
jgi:hypothetical protein